MKHEFEIEQPSYLVEDWPAKTVQAPRIAECLVNLECRLVWHHPLYPHSHVHLFAGKVVHLAVDTTVMVPDPVERMRRMGLMYNVRNEIDYFIDTTAGGQGMFLFTSNVTGVEVPPENIQFAYRYLKGEDWKRQRDSQWREWPGFRYAKKPKNAAFRLLNQHPLVK